MFHILSIFRKVCKQEYNGCTYGTNKLKITCLKMCIVNNIILLVLLSRVKSSVGETEYFPGLRRPPSASNWSPSQPDENSYLLAQLNSFIEEQARRRFQQQLAQQHYYQRQLPHQRGSNLPEQYVPEPTFTFQLPEKAKIASSANIPFAVAPGDPRYYANSSKNDNGYNSNEYNENMQTPNMDNSIDENRSNDDVPYYKLKSPMNVNPKPAEEKHIVQHLSEQDQLSALVEKLQRHEASNRYTLEGQNDRRMDVIKKQLTVGGNMGIYIVALIAGISAAVTVGLIAVGIGWYTLHKRAKAAADVEYPAYGVTGPNKDISPSGDRRLAQSAQMYHYQHQKQQIIAMENRPPGDNHGIISDVESDDDNEEGDYTVYECPGLAPTGEMEVKNPLFLDDTPVTPLNVLAENQRQPGSDKQDIQKQNDNMVLKSIANEKKKYKLEK